MARISAVDPKDAGLLARLAFRFGPRMMAKQTGNFPDGGLEPMAVMAHQPKLFNAYMRLEGVTSKLDSLPERLQHLTQLRAATMVECEYCIDIGSQVARRSGMSDEELLGLADHRGCGLFSELEMLVLDYVTALSRTPLEVSDELVTALRAELSDAQIVELTHLAAIENYRGRVNHSLGIGAAGFSEGMVCALPVDHASASHAVASGGSSPHVSSAAG